MSVNRYGVMARRHWARWLPREYAAIGDPESFFTTLGEEVARQIDDLTDELADEIGQGDSYLARVGQLLAARAIAEELILPQRILPEAELSERRRPGGGKARVRGTARGRGPQPPVMGGGERRTARARERP